MKHFFLFLIFCLSSKFLIAQNDVRAFGVDTILWNENVSLHFSDFKAKPGRSFQGLTYSGLYLDMKKDNKKTQVFCYTVFISQKSFLKDSSDELLKHEQLHFDITELYARKMRQQISKISFQNEKNASLAIQKIYNSVTTAFNNEQDEYDKETEHGINKAKQKQWIDSVHNQLNNLKIFAPVEIDIQ